MAPQKQEFKDRIARLEASAPEPVECSESKHMIGSMTRSAIRTVFQISLVMALVLLIGYAFGKDLFGLVAWLGGGLVLIALGVPVLLAVIYFTLPLLFGDDIDSSDGGLLSGGIFSGGDSDGDGGGGSWGDGDGGGD